MFAIEPYTAKRLVAHANDDGGVDMTTEQCRVLGITSDEAGAPVYIVEVFEDDESYLTTEEVLTRPAPSVR